MKNILTLRGALVAAAIVTAAAQAAPVSPVTANPNTGALVAPSNFWTANASGIGSALAATYQPLDADLTSIAALATTTYGRSLLTQADAAAARSTLGAVGYSSAAVSISSASPVTIALNGGVSLGGQLTTAGMLTTDGDVSITGAHALQMRLTGATDVTLPTSGTLAGLAANQTFSGSNNFTGGIAISGTALGNAATRSVGTGTANVAAGDLAGQIASQGIISNRDNGTPWCAAKYSAWTTGGGGSMTPLRMVVFGDSLSTGIAQGPRMAVAGVISGNGAISTTGTVTAVTNSGTTWITGKYDNFAAGSSGVYTESGSATGDVIGNEIAVYYIKEPGAGTFDLQYSSNAGSSWTTAATIDASNASVIGAANTYSVSLTNFPRYRLRINNVTGGPVKIIGWGIYNTNGGGVIVSRGIANLAGIDLSVVVTVPTAIFTPIWTSIAPDLVISCWADAASEWESGGNWRTMYSRMKSAKNATDFVQICANPAEDETGRLDQRESQFEWARETGESYIDGYSIFGSYTLANAKGLMGDTVHLSAAGVAFRNDHIWNTLALGQVPLGRLPLFGGGASRFSGADSYPGLEFKVSSAYGGAYAYFSNPLAVIGGLQVLVSGSPSPGTAATFSHDGTNVILQRNGSTFALSGESSITGWHPASNNLMLGGRGDFRWRGAFGGISLGYTEQTGAYTLTTSDHTVNVTSGTGPITFPAATASSSSTSFTANVAAGITGKVFVIKNSGTATVQLATTSSQTIDGASPGTLTTGQAIKVQSTGTSYITIP